MRSTCRFIHHPVIIQWFPEWNPLHCDSSLYSSEPIGGGSRTRVTYYKNANNIPNYLIRNTSEIASGNIN